jgi:hypothetical protein
MPNIFIQQMHINLEGGIELSSQPCPFVFLSSSSFFWGGGGGGGYARCEGALQWHIWWAPVKARSSKDNKKWVIGGYGR